MIIMRQQGNPIDGIISILDRVARLKGRDTSRIADTVRGGFADNFAAQRAGDGAAWAPLAPATQRDRARKGFGPTRPILIRRGDYLGSFTNSNHKDHVDVVEFTPDGVRISVGSKDKRVGPLSEGTQSMPGRPVVPLSARAQARIGTTIESVIDSLVRHGR